MSTLREYVRRLNPEKIAKHIQLHGPRKTSKTTGVVRYVFAAVPVARLLSSRRAELRALLEAHYNSDRPPAPTKVQLVQQSEQDKLVLEDQIADLQSKLQRAQDAKRQAAGRSTSARKDWEERCRERLKSAREVLKEQAQMAAEAAVQDEMARINVLRNKANARARGAESREATSHELAAKRLQTAQEAVSKCQEVTAALNEELREQFEGSSTQRRGADALAKLAQIPKLGTVAVRRKVGGTKAWDKGMRALIVELILNGTPTHAIPGNIQAFASYLLPFVKDVNTPTVRFCQGMRSELRVGTETLVAYLLGNAFNWRQLFTDGTSRRQIHLLNVIIGIDGPDGNILPLKSSCAPQ